MKKTTILLFALLISVSSFSQKRTRSLFGWHLEKDTPVKLVFNRKDSTTCLEKAVFPDFGVDAELPMNQDVAIPIDTSKAGEFEYSCGMHMFHGKIVIK